MGQSLHSKVVSSRKYPFAHTEMDKLSMGRSRDSFPFDTWNLFFEFHHVYMLFSYLICVIKMYYNVQSNVHYHSNKGVCGMSQSMTLTSIKLHINYMYFLCIK